MSYITIFTISIHALREEGDVHRRLPFRSYSYFYPRPPRGGRPHDFRHSGATLLKISIHALREEGDHCSVSRELGIMYFYPRPPRGGRQT